MRKDFKMHIPDNVSLTPPLVLKEIEADQYIYNLNDESYCQIL